MQEIVVKANNLGKKYIISHEGKADYTTFREKMIEGMGNIFSKTKRLFSGQQILEGEKTEEFWALRDLNFEIRKGDRVGIVGKNGAGKSTLLKVLSRITDPTTGKVSIKGRVASLLEVGTGFHPELSGRENIFLNGAIMGMSRVEIRKKFDEIVDFSGVEKFLDTPVKRFSSGMYVRLAFSVAAHLEPEILVVDEVLAVGDAEFQKKCLGKMQDVSNNEGRTVLFVSHNLMALSSLCNYGIYLKQGQLQLQGNIENVLSAYTRDGSDHHQTEWNGDEGDDNVRIYGTKVNCVDSPDGFFTHKDIMVEIEGEIKQPVFGLILGFWLYSQFDYQLAYTLFDDQDPDIDNKTHPTGKFVKRFLIPANTLAFGSYKIHFDFGIHNKKSIVKSELCAIEFTVENICGIGRKYLIDYRGYKSLLRPNWSKEKFDKSKK